MRKLTFILIAFAISYKLDAQVFPNNELKINISNVIAFASFEIGYEHLFDYSQSFDVEILINDRINFYSEQVSKKFNTSSIKLGYNFYFGTENPGSEWYFNPFVKYRFGEFEEEESVEIDMNTFIIGIGFGYKWNFSNSFIIAVYGSIGRNFSDEVQERFQAIEFHAGVGVGYRF